MKNDSGNPALSKRVLEAFEKSEATSKATIFGTSVKILALLAISIVGGYFGWQSMQNGTIGFMLVGSIGMAVILSIVTTFRPFLAGITGPLYALAQGYALGAISQTYNVTLDGIVIQAIGLTGAIFFVCLWAFWLGVIRVSNNFIYGVIIATLGVGLYYFMAFILSIFGVNAPLIFDTGTWGIVFSLLLITIATLNIMVDFEFIKRLEKQGAPKTMEWYGAFALIVTLLWLYFEALRLVGNIRQ